MGLSNSLHKRVLRKSLTFFSNTSIYINIHILKISNIL
ncbi:unnamed protein product [Spirodela intermedia]|uniref:Uncharacterized protein n=1 Tax=Spirodela intermedia TaxID=51605 RepID=A0A7I8K687_SPIIN|nr:unnamed protein product [Spirodela intermedia]